jgi:hypothetical protein
VGVRAGSRRNRFLPDSKEMKENLRCHRHDTTPPCVRREASSHPRLRRRRSLVGYALSRIRRQRIGTLQGQHRGTVTRRKNGALTEPMPAVDLYYVLQQQQKKMKKKRKRILPLHDEKKDVHLCYPALPHVYFRPRRSTTMVDLDELSSHF